MQCENDNTDFVLIKYPAAASDLQDKCRHVMKDVEQEVKDDLPTAGHEDKMSASKYHQPAYLHTHIKQRFNCY